MAIADRLTKVLLASLMLVFLPAATVTAAEAHLFAGFSTEGRLDVSNFTIFGFGLASCGILCLEGSAEFSNGKDFKTLPQGEDLKTSIQHYSGNVLYPMGSAGIVPYIAAGLGFTRFGVSGSLDNGDFLRGSHFHTNYGFGLKIGLPGLGGLRFDYRRYRVKLGDDRSKTTIPEAGIDLGDVLKLNRYTFGFYMRF